MTGRGFSGRVITGMLIAAVAPLAWAQEAEPASAAEAVSGAGRWTLRVEPSVWFAGPAGRVHMPTRNDGGSTVTGEIGALSLPGGSEERFDLGELEIDTPEPGISGEIHLGRGDWRFLVRGMNFSGDEEVTATGTGSVESFEYTTGDVISSELDYAQFELEVGYSLIRRDLEPYEKGHKLHTNFEALAGARVYDIEFNVLNATSGTSSAGSDETFFEPQVGARLAMEVYEQFDIDVQLTAAWMPIGDNSSITVDVMTGGVWRPIENLGFQFGYRLTGFDLQSEHDDGDFEWRGSMAGVYLGVVVQF